MVNQSMPFVLIHLLDNWISLAICQNREGVSGSCARGRSPAHNGGFSAGRSTKKAKIRPGCLSFRDVGLCCALPTNL